MVLFEDLVVPEAPPGGTRASRHQGPREKDSHETRKPQVQALCPPAAALLQDLSTGDQGDSAGLSNEK